MLAVKKKAKEYRENNKSKIAAYRELHKAGQAEKAKKYREANKEVGAERCRKYQQKNKAAIAVRMKRYRKENPIPTFIRRSLTRLMGNWNGGRSKKERLLGYTIEQLTQRIEFNFKDGMSWDNKSEWHIDHKKPISRFLSQGITDPKIINALSNLQPLWAKENLSKGSKF
jgi:hypothetical protein